MIIVTFQNQIFHLEASKDIPMLPDERRKIYVERGISKLNTQKVINHREMSDFLNT